jgi:hypothetical protein
MLLPALRRFHRRRGYEPPQRPAVVPVALVLVGASYDYTGPTLTLVFDRAIDIDALSGSAIGVEDAQENFFRYTGDGGAELLGPATVRITLIPFDDAGGTGVRLTASGLSGIVAVDDGGTWAGVSELALPFP